MKKILLGMAIVCAACTFTSCEDQPACYKITVTVGDTTTESYTYGTKENVDLVAANAKKAAEVTAALLGKEVKVSKKKVNKNEADCALANAGLETAK